jgi:hypothetical protein
VPPSQITGGDVVDVTDTEATVAFAAPGDDGLVGTASGYEIRYLAAVPMNEDNFADGTASPASLRPEVPGTMQSFTLRGLLPQTHYYVGVRAYDGCMNYGPLRVIDVVTDPRRTGEVDACFVATAAYGSIMANDVDLLRRFRDMTLRRSVLGELAVETYYTFGPALAGVIGESDQLRGVARDGLAPVVAWIRGMTWNDGR